MMLSRIMIYICLYMLSACNSIAKEPTLPSEPSHEQQIQKEMDQSLRYLSKSSGIVESINDQFAIATHQQVNEQMELSGPLLLRMILEETGAGQVEYLSPREFRYTVESRVQGLPSGPLVSRLAFHGYWQEEGDDLVVSSGQLTISVKGDSRQSDSIPLVDLNQNGEYSLDLSLLTRLYQVLIDGEVQGQTTLAGGRLFYLVKGSLLSLDAYDLSWQWAGIEAQIEELRIVSEWRDEFVTGVSLKGQLLDSASLIPLGEFYSELDSKSPWGYRLILKDL